MAVEGVSARPRQRLQEELVPRRQSARSEERKSDSARSGVEQRERTERGRRRGRGRNEQTQPTTAPQTQPQTSAPSTGPTTPVTTQPVGSATPIQSDQARSLAERYVSQFEQQSGNTLSAEERSSKVQEVANFYDDPSRIGRLSKIVFA